jgi:hypothetical protein
MRQGDSGGPGFVPSCQRLNIGAQFAPLAPGSHLLAPGSQIYGAAGQLQPAGAAEPH